MNYATSKIAMFLVVGGLLGGCASAAATADEPKATVEESPAEATSPPGSVNCPEQPGLCFKVTPTTAVITINGEAAGTVGDLQASGYFLKRPRGIYQISLEAEGHVTWRAEVSISESVETISVNLSLSPPSSP